MIKANMSTRHGRTVVQLEGFLSFENTKNFASFVENYYQENPQGNLIFDCSKLEFIGSSGLSTFIQVLKKYNNKEYRPSFFGLKKEFVRLFRALEGGSPFRILEQEHNSSSELHNRL